MKEEDLSWAERLVERGAWVFHVESRVAGKVVELIPPGAQVRQAVLKFHQGHTFVAKAGNFVELTENDSVFASELEAGVALMVATAARRGGELAVHPGVGAMVIAAVLRAQVFEVERLFPSSAASPDHL